MDKILNNQISNSLLDTLKKRSNSSLYGTFILYWFIFHWDFIYTMFFVSEDRIWNSMLLFKNDYLIKIYFDYTSLKFYIFWVLPIIFTWLTIWIFPNYLIIPAFKKEEEGESEKQIIKLREQKKLIKATTELEVANAEKINIEAENLKKEKEIKDDEAAIWNKEFESIKSHPLFPRFKEIAEIVYGNNGRTHKIINSRWTRVIPTDIMAFAHTRGLIEINRGEHDYQESINLTEKGKFFAENIY